MCIYIGGDDWTEGLLSTLYIPTLYDIYFQKLFFVYSTVFKLRYLIGVPTYSKVIGGI